MSMFNIILLGITSLLTDISSEMIYPILPVYLVVQLGATPAVLGFIEGIAESAASLLKVYSGYFSDKLKRRKPLTILGYASSAVGKLFLYLSTAWTCVFAARLVDRFGKGVRVAPRDALIAESSPAQKRGSAFGLHRTMDTIGAVIGVTVAYFLFTRFINNFRLVFLYSLVPAVLGVLVLFFVREKRQAIQTDLVSKPNLPKLDFLQSFKNLDRRLKTFLIITFIFTLGNSSNQFLLLRAKNLGNSTSAVILLYLVYNISYAVFAWPMGRLSDRIGRKPILVAGYLFYGLVYFGFAFLHSSSLWLLFILYGIYIGFTEGVEKAFVSDLAPQELRATFIGLHATLVGIGLLPASLLAGFLWKILGAAVPFYFGGIMAVFASIGLLIFI